MKRKRVEKRKTQTEKGESAENLTIWVVMKSWKRYYTAFELVDANILIFKGSNFKISLGYLSVLDMVNVNKSALSDFFTICQTNILLNGLEISNFNGNFCLESGIQKICKMESHCSKFYIVFKQAVCYI